jgi:hypothetical protein
MKPQELLLCYPVLYQSKSNTAYTDEWSHIYTSKWQKFEHNHKDIQERKRQINLLKISGFFTYHQVYHSKILHGACFVLNVL